MYARLRSFFSKHKILVRAFRFFFTLLTIKGTACDTGVSAMTGFCKILLDEPFLFYGLHLATAFSSKGADEVRWAWAWVFFFRLGYPAGFLASCKAQQRLGSGF
jgi:hypothetical protein